MSAPINNLYIGFLKGGVKDSTIPTNGSVVKFLGTGTTTFSTDANGGSLTAEGIIQASFYDDVSRKSVVLHVPWTKFCRFSLGLLLHNLPTPIPICK